MPKTVKIGGNQYEISPIPPYIHPYVDLYTKLARKCEQIETIQQAEEISGQLERAVTKIIEATVDPKAEKSDESRLIVYILRYNNEVNEEFFRSFPTEPSVNKESRGTGTSTPQKAEPIAENR